MADPNFIAPITNPFGLTDVGTSATPTLADIDGDGDLDAFVGNNAGNTLFYRNSGTTTAPTFTFEATNPFGLTDVGFYSKPTFADIDSDGDLDAFVGNFNGNTVFYRNSGTTSAPTFTLDNPNLFGLTGPGIVATPTFADIDGDGDLDAFVGINVGNTLFYRNSGTTTAPTFTLEATNPFGLTNVGRNAAPTFADIDGDGDLDAFVGNSVGNTLFYRNSGTATAPTLTLETTNPFGLTDVGASAIPTFADIDGDGDLDAFIGNSAGNTLFFENTPVSTSVNNPPTANNDTATTSENTSVTGNVLTNDTDPDAGNILTVAAVNGVAANVGNQITLASGAFLTLNANGTYTYNPNAQFESLAAGATAADNFDYTISDGNGGTDTATVNVTINGVNDAPTVANAIADQTTLEDGFFSFTLPANTFGDVDAGDSLTYAATLANGNPLPTWLSFNANTRTFSGTPNDPNNGTISIKVTATDTSNASANDTFDLTVTPVNDAPVAGDDSASANQNTPLTLLAANLLANDTDVDSSTLSITAVSNAVNGTVTLNNSGNVVFTPTTGFNNGNGSFNYTVSDGNGGTDLGLVTVAVGTTLKGTTNNDTLSGTSGNDIINGLNGQDTISGNAGNDNLVGENGDDSLSGGAGNDTLLGGNGQDTLNGDAGNDRLEGDNGDDFLNGGDGNDSLIGDNGQDLLVGGAGNDFLRGDKADDNLTGGTGNDIFVLEKAAGRDTISDFSLGEGDKIGLSGLSFSQLSFFGNEIRLGNQALAVLTAFNTTTLTQNNFTSV
ncbi:MAG: Ig-like domain-containing protein [Nostoc sp.]|uniref:Ig-like domain-containing protein n=1 Tax=Nostoc sp. TaxID=1180 RepID=UPI002FF64DBE